MKKLTLSLMMFSAIGTLALAGGNSAVAKPAVVEIPQVRTSGTFYGGLGYGYFNQQNDDIGYDTQSVWSTEIETDNILLQVGYQYNAYIALEARYWLGMGDATITAGIDNVSRDESGDYASWGVYMKPTYPVTDTFNIYAMLGYASTSLDADSGAYWDTDGFSWGAGAEFGVTEHLFIFADYVNLMTPDSFDLHTPKYGVVPDIDMDGDLYTFNLGVTYKF